MFNQCKYKSCHLLLTDLSLHTCHMTGLSKYGWCWQKCVKTSLLSFQVISTFTFRFLHAINKDKPTRTCRMYCHAHYRTTSCWYCSTPHTLDRGYHSSCKEQPQQCSEQTQQEQKTNCTHIISDVKGVSILYGPCQMLHAHMPQAQI